MSTGGGGGGSGRLEAQKAYEEARDQRHDLCTLVAGYAWGALESIYASDQISINVKLKVQQDLEYIRPIISKIWNLGDIKKEYEASLGEEYKQRRAEELAKLDD